MQKLGFLTTLLVLGFVSSAAVIAQDKPRLFTLRGTTPIIEHGGVGEWDARYNDPGAVFFHEGKFHMLRNGLPGFPAGASIGYYTSEDGLDWIEMSDDPVLTTADVPFANITAQIGSAFILDDGTWVMYFHVLDTGSFPLSGGSIGMATANEPLGPWDVHPEPILLPGGDTEWDNLQVSHPRVVLHEETYYMYYSAYNRRGRMAIGLATSADGLTWTKYDDPLTIEAPYAESDPVLTQTQDWEETYKVQHPSVVITPDGWIMTYRSPGNGYVGREAGIGMAHSEDGIHWTKLETNPVFRPEDIPEGHWIWVTTLAYHEGTYYLYMEASTQVAIGGATDIYVATYEGDFPSTE